ncbi:MAG: gamma-glutamyltransferase [Acidobacteriota bacterium]|nr:gamma-glutamyltransferase [Acidobacteriota bacterium]MDQ5870930.1 gamma-glutamyltransferase [Acidobacteriota bacterium]
MPKVRGTRVWGVILTVLAGAAAVAVSSAATNKPPLHAKKWLAITGKPLAATAGAMIFQKGGNAVDSACAMIAATCTMWDTLSWGGETQALIYNPRTGKVIGINALGVAPTGATPEYYRSKSMAYPPEYGPLSAVTPGTPGGIMVMLAEFGKLSLAEVLAPAIEMADGYPIEQQLISTVTRQRDWLMKWPESRRVLLPRPGDQPPAAGEIFKQPDLAVTLRKLVEAEKQALASGKSRKDAILAAYERFYRGDVARELVRGSQELGGLITLEDLANWKVRIEEPVKTTYKGIDVYKLDLWTQGPAMLQALNILETMDVKAMGYNSARYIHALYQAMNLAFADRDFYYGDTYFPPEEPRRGLLSKEYAKARAAGIDWTKNDAKAKPGDPYPFQAQKNPYAELLAKWPPPPAGKPVGTLPDAGTTSVEAADAEGWVVSVTPSGGWVPAAIAGKTGIGLSQRAQAFVLDRAENPYNVIEPGKRPRVTLTPTLALKDGKPYLAFAVQGADTQDQNLLQFFLNVVEFGMTVQEATEAANVNSEQLRSSFGAHESKPGSMTIHPSLPPWVRAELTKMGYTLRVVPKTSGPINAIFFDRPHGTMWGGSSDHGEDYGIGW